MRFRDMPTQILQECPFDGLIFGAGFEHFTKLTVEKFGYEFLVRIVMFLPNTFSHRYFRLRPVTGNE